MKVSFEKNSFLDYPGKITSVIFFSGCDLNCWYCHNRQILKEGTGSVELNEVYAFLEKRRGFIDAVTMSGGEALLNRELPEVIQHVRDMGFLVKLDTNGCHPEKLKELVSAGMIDYVAMDIKAPPGKYHLVTPNAPESTIFETAESVMSFSIPYEFRTTYMPLLSEDDIVEIAKTVKGAHAYFVQQYVEPPYLKGHLYPKAKTNREVEAAAKRAREFIPATGVRGI